MSGSYGGPQVVVLVGDAHDDTAGQDCGTGQKSGRKFDSGNKSAQKSGDFPHDAHAQLLNRGSGAGQYNPHHVHQEFPDKWRAYIRANYRNLSHVQQVFGVSERAARKWWNGEGGVNAGYVAIAKAEHPVQAERMLFAAE